MWVTKCNSGCTAGCEAVLLGLTGGKTYSCPMGRCQHQGLRFPTNENTCPTRSHSGALPAHEGLLEQVANNVYLNDVKIEKEAKTYVKIL
jgi:hypothetical protein